MDIAATIKFFEDNPFATIKEAGITKADANALVGSRKIIEVGPRKTGQRGRPPMEYVAASYDLSDDQRVQESVEKAKAKLSAHRRFERLSRAIVDAADEHGHGSSEHIAAVLARKEAFELTGYPDLPAKNDYVLAGEIEDDVEDDVLSEMVVDDIVGVEVAA